jgi:prenylcysteine alpha-carboxyl methylesterase
MIWWILFPYFVVWLLYLLFADRSIEWMGFHVPRFPVDPKRVLKLNYELIKMIVGYLFGPPMHIAFIHLKNWWIQHTHYVKRNINFGSRHETTKLDVYPSVFKSRPVIVFMYGGGWGSGSKRLYAPVAHTLSENGYVVVVPDYSIYPKGTAEDMIYDTEKVIEWVMAHIEEYGGDSSNIVLVSHSAGAHLSVLTIVNHAIRGVQLQARQRSLSSSEMTKESSQLHKIRGMVMLSGPYDISDHYIFESERGVEEISCMGRLFGNSKELFDKHSPIKLLDREIINGPLKEYLPRSWLLLHSLQDKIVPFISSSKLYDRLEAAGIPHLVLKSEKDSEHAKHIFDLFLGNGQDFLIELRDFYARCEAMGL